MADGEVKLKISAEAKEARKHLKETEDAVVKIGQKIEEVEKKIKSFEQAQVNAASASSKEYRKLLHIQEDLAREEQKRAQLQKELAYRKQDVKLTSTAVASESARITAKTEERDSLIDRKEKLDSKFSIQEILDLQSKIEKLNREITESTATASALEKKLIQDKKEEEKVTKQLEQSEEKIRKLRQKESSQDPAYTQAKQDDIKKWIDLQRQLNDLTEQYKDALNQASQARKSVDDVQEQEDKIAGYASLQKVLLGVGKAYAFVGKIAYKVAKAFIVTPVLNLFKKLHKSVTSFGRRLRFVLLQGLLFRNMRKYLSEFAQALGNALKQNEQFNASLANLKGTFWAAIAPVVDAVAPILARFLDMIAKLITYLSGLVGILFKIGKASKTAGAGLAEAGQKGKEASNNLASWDTIQNLDTGSGGDAGGISPTFGQDFEEAYSDLEKFRELFEKGDWFEIGKYVGEELSKVIALIDNWINSTLAPKIIQWAKNIGSFINGFFVGMDWSNLGKTVGDAIVSVFNGISTFLETVDWMKIGESVKEFLLGIPWGEILKSVGRAIVDAIVAAIDFVEGLTGIDLTTFTDIFKELFDLFKDTIDLLSGDMTFSEWFSQLSDDQVDIAFWVSVAGAILGVITVFKTLSSLISVFTTVIIPALGAALKFLAANPIVAIIAGIVILIRVIVQVIKHWDEIKETVNTVITAIKEWIQEAVESIKGWVQGIIEAVSGWIEKFIQDAKAWWNNAVDSTKQFVQQIKDIINSIVTKVKEIVATIKEKVQGIVQSVISFVTTLKDKVVSIIGTIKEKAQGVIDSIRNGVKSAINFIIRIINGLIGGVETAINTIVSGLNRISFSTPDWIPIIGGRHFGFDLNSVYLRRIPELAQGAVVNPSHEFAAILGDNRQEQEIVSPLSTMKQALLDALSEYSGNTEVVLEVDGRKFATALVPHINNRSRAYGTSVII